MKKAASQIEYARKQQENLMDEFGVRLGLIINKNAWGVEIKALNGETLACYAGKKKEKDANNFLRGYLAGSVANPNLKVA